MGYFFASLNSFPQDDADGTFQAWWRFSKKKKKTHKYKSWKVQSIPNDCRSQI